MRVIHFAAVAALIATPVSIHAQVESHKNHSRHQGQEPVTLYDNLGSHHYEITTTEPRAQAFFDQGLRLYYAFNHQEAIRAFKESQRLDPNCAMCWWGEALSWGPNINMPMDSAGGAAAYAAIQRAVAVKRNTNPRERAFIDALATRYAADPVTRRAQLDSAYANAMADVAKAHPNDAEATVLYGESIMDLRPWDYWTAAGKEQPGMRTALAGFQSVLERNANHPGACHFYIHAVEKVYPERAVPCAEHLASLMPGAGHLVHMPGHIYIRVGRFEDAIRVNEHAVHADETYIQDQQPRAGVYTAGYYPHNYDFLAFAASMIGRSEQAIMAADRVAAVVPAELLNDPSLAFLQHYTTRSLQMRVRFQKWEEILQVPAPADHLLHAQGIWHYARGRALAAKGQIDAARTELQGLRTSAEHPMLAGVVIEPNMSQDILGIAVRVLAGSIAAAQGKYDDAVAELREGVLLEDALLYGEPPEWSVPVRQELGAVLLAAGRRAEAEQAYREDLEHFPGNSWSTEGLRKAGSSL